MATNLRSFVNTNEFQNFRRGFLFESKYGIEDPTFLSFNVQFNLNSFLQYDSKLMNSPLFTRPGDGYGAIEYLSLLGYKKESDYLDKFRDIISWIQDTTPWYFQSIEGLNEVWKLSTDISKPLQTAVLTFNCLESVDLRMAFLANLYRSAIYDTVYMREVVPENLRYFEMSIQVCEFRNIRATLDALDNVKMNALTDEERLLRLESIVNQLNYIEFVFTQCEFDFSESFPGGDSVDNADPKMANGKFKIKVHKWYEKNKFPYFDTTMIRGVGHAPQTQDEYNVDKIRLDETNKLKTAYTGDNFGIFSNAIKKADIIKDNVLGKIGRAPAELIGGVVNKLESKLTPMGNVYKGKPLLLNLPLTNKKVYDDINKFIPPNIRTELGNVYDKKPQR